MQRHVQDNAASQTDIRNPQRAFSLIELLVVITILGLLISILLPSLSKAKLVARAADTRSRIQNLSAACQLYKQDTGYYPGQRYPDQLTTYTGSQVLAASLLGYTYSELTSTNPIAEKASYVAMQSGLIDRFYNQANSKWESKFTKRPASILDGFPEADAILYYPSVIGATGSVTTAYAFSHNDEPSYFHKGEVVGEFQKLIADTKFGFLNGSAFGTNDWPIKSDGAFTASKYRAVNSDTFILIGAGVDRKFFTDDDVKNW